MTKLRAGAFLRWTAKRKRALVDRLDALTQAGEHQAAAALLVEHNISEEELATWRSYLAKEGARIGHRALRATRVQDYRRIINSGEMDKRGNKWGVFPLPCTNREQKTS